MTKFENVVKGVGNLTSYLKLEHSSKFGVDDDRLRLVIVVFKVLRLFKKVLTSVLFIT
jgi:hypothetical protein